MLRMMFAGIALLSCFATVGESRAQCRTVNELESELETRISRQSFTRIEGLSAAAFMTAFNAIPPESHHVADVVLLVSENSMPVHPVFAFRQGCLVGRTVLSPGQLKTIMDYVSGTGA